MCSTSRISSTCRLDTARPRSPPNADGQTETNSTLPRANSVMRVADRRPRDVGGISSRGVQSTEEMRETDRVSACEQNHRANSALLETDRMIQRRHPSSHKQGNETPNRSALLSILKIDNAAIRLPAIEKYIYSRITSSAAPPLAHRQDRHKRISK